jgi:hypothetical protein
MMASPPDKPGWAQRTSPFAQIIAFDCDSQTTGGPIAWLFDRIASGFCCAEREVGRLPVGCGDQVLRHPQQRRQDQGINDRYRYDANGKPPYTPTAS